MTYIVTGVRGSGKSTNLAALIAHALINEVRVLSNMPVAFRCKYPLNSYGDSKIETLETLPLNMELLLSLNSSIQKALLVLDEIKNWLSNQQWQMPRQKLLNAAINQMRKNRLDLAGSCKDAMKLDPTFRDDELDIVLHCQDMHVFKRSIPRGKHFRVQGWDWSGAWTGWPWFPGKEPDLLLQLTDADRIWHIFDSYQVQDFWEANAKLDPQFENRKIGKNGFVQEQVQTISEEEVQKNLISIMARFNDRILQTDLWRHLGIAPTQNNRETKFAVSQIMDDLGIVTKGHYYVRDYEMVKV